VKEFKREINRVIHQRFIESEWQSISIKQWYGRTIALDRNWRESKKVEEWLKSRRNNRALVPRSNNAETNRQQLLQPQVWPRRQEILQQWTLAGPALIERVERINIVMVCFNQRIEFASYNPYAIEIDRGNRNCYSCREFGHLA